MNYKKPIIDKLSNEKNIIVTNRFLGLMIAKFKSLVDYEYSNIDLLVDFSNNILFEEFASMIEIYNSANYQISQFNE